MILMNKIINHEGIMNNKIIIIVSLCLFGILPPSFSQINLNKKPILTSHQLKKLNFSNRPIFAFQNQKNTLFLDYHDIIIYKFNDKWNSLKGNASNGAKNWNGAISAIFHDNSINILNLNGQILNYSLPDLNFQVKKIIDSKFFVQQIFLEQKQLTVFSDHYIPSKSRGFLVKDKKSYTMPTFPFSSYAKDINKTHPWYLSLKTTAAGDGSYLQTPWACLENEINILHFDNKGSIISVYSINVPIKDYQPRPFNQKSRRVVDVNSMFLIGDKIFIQWFLPTNKTKKPFTQLLSKDGTVLQSFDENEVSPIIRPGIQMDNGFFTYDKAIGIEKITIVNKKP